MNANDANIDLTQAQTRLLNAQAVEKENDNKLFAEFSEPDEPPLEVFGIGRAIKEMQNGRCVSRENWNGPGQFLELQVPDDQSKMTLPYIYISTVQGDLVPWLASQTDILATDWYVVECGGEEGVTA